MTPFYALLALVALREVRDLYLIRRGQLIQRPKPQPARPKEPTP